MSGPTLSTHVLDTERGVPAAGVPVSLYVADAAEPLARSETNADGRIPQLAALEPRRYRLVFDVAEYFARQGRAAPFLTRVSIEFEASAADRHYHVPLLLSPYACTSYRGS